VATELFSANLATTTVTSGGSSAPASGTTETWTVASSAMFGAAASGVSQFHVADPAAPAETIAVTNVSGVTWTVTRGAESTNTVVHAAGFTVYQVTTAGTLTSFSQAQASTVPSDTGYAAWNYDPLLTALSITFSSLPSAGSRYLARLDVHTAVTVSAIWAMWIKPSGGTPANNFLALYNSAGTQVGSTTSDFTATATGLQGFSVGSVTLAAGIYYAAYVCGTQGTTPGGLAWSTAVNGNTGGISGSLLFGDSAHTAAKYRFAVNGTGASSLPSSFTLSSNSSVSTYPFWAALA